MREELSAFGGISIAANGAGGQSLRVMVLSNARTKDKSENLSSTCPIHHTRQSKVSRIYNIAPWLDSVLKPQAALVFTEESIFNIYLDDCPSTEVRFCDSAPVLVSVEAAGERTSYDNVLSDVHASFTATKQQGKKSNMMK